MKRAMTLCAAVLCLSMALTTVALAAEGAGLLSHRRHPQ